MPQRQDLRYKPTKLSGLNETGCVLGLRKVRIQDQNSAGYFRQNVKEFPRLIQMIEKPTTEHDVEDAVFFNVPDIVYYELEVRQIDLGFRIATCFDVQWAHIDAQRLEA
jgi:hypothetical protein